ncbi:MAG TPA: phosphate uptake regulator PhoU [Candidatus Thermoplasmatota archaeon]|nr:phosphate uptake regulator PhoU [Candidatus Thermoplasmatota archaeon]
MEYRKIQKTGGATFAVTLPKPWARKAGLRAGDLVGLQAQGDGTLVLTPGRPGRRENGRGTTARIRLAEESRDELQRRVIAAYLAGFDLVEIESPRIRPAERALVRELVRRLMGAEIIEETSDRIVVQDLADTSEFDMRRGVRRMSRVARSMHEDAMKAIADSDAELGRDVEGRDDELDRLYWLVNKQYHLVLRNPRAAEGMGVTGTTGLGFLLVGRILERIGDHAARMAQTVPTLAGSRIPPAILEELREASAVSLSIVQEAVEALYGEDFERANVAIRRSKELSAIKKDLLGRLVKLRPEIVLPLTLVLESIERTGNYGTDIGEIAINHLYAK